MSKLQPWELTDDEMVLAGDEELKRYLSTENYGSADTIKVAMEKAHRRGITNAAVKKVVGWLDDNNGSSVAHGFGAGVGDDELLLDRDDWQAIKQEVGL